MMTSFDEKSMLCPPKFTRRLRAFVSIPTDRVAATFFGSTTIVSTLVFIVALNCLQLVSCGAATEESAIANRLASIMQAGPSQQQQGPNATTNDDDVVLWRQHATESHQERHRAKRTSTDYQIIGFRLEATENEVHYGSDGVPSVRSLDDFTIRVFGRGITQETAIAFTTAPNEYGGPCMFPATMLFKALPGSATGTTGLYKVSLPKEADTTRFYICARQEDPNLPNVALVHQGKDVWNQIISYELLLPLWASLCIILVCLCFSALFSGLNLGLMSLDRTELKILRNTGSPKERAYAKKIQPVRDQGNFLLCSILLGNVLVNSTFTILLDGLTSGLVAVICSTLAIVIFGEITPQAICSRHGLAIGAKTIHITKVVMAITSPLAYPTSKLLDYMLGEEIGNVYNRERLKELVKVTTGQNDLDRNEVNIISGALELRKKTVADVMTKIEDAFMLPLDAELDFGTVSEIMNSGFSRIPVYDGERKNIITLLYIKDLAFVDTDDNTPLKTLCEFYQNPVHFVFEDYTLDVMFNQFKEGSIGHIAFVHRVNNEGDGDPFYETTGLVTLEDVIEELIQAEIVDETDVFTDNRTKVRRHRRKKQDFSMFAERRDNQTIRISPQLTLATFQYLSTVDAFKREYISETILRRLLNQDIIHSIKSKGKEKNDPTLFIYTQGKAVDFFVLILEGRVEVTVGQESLLFESGPFTYFGIQALIPHIVMESPTQRGSLQSLNLDSKIRQTFVPDYSVRAASDVIYIAIKRSLYLTAKKATLLEKSRKSGVDPSGEAIDDDVEMLLHSLNEDDKITRCIPNSRKISATNGSHTISPSLNDLSQQSHSIAAAQLNSQFSNSADMMDGVSLSSQLGTQDQVNERNHDAADGDADINGEQIGDHNVATTPLLPKPHGGGGQSK